MSKLAIEAETEEDKYETTTTVKCYECGDVEVDRTKGNVGKRPVMMAISHTDIYSCQR